MSDRVAVFFRTHTWDSYIARQAAAIQKLSQGGHFYVLADETRSTLPIDDYYKFSHCDTDFEPLGLARYFNTNLLWYNGDYPLYKIVGSLPHYDFYVMIEYDVLTNINLVGMMQEASRRGVDAVGYGFHEVEPEWPWLDSCDGIYDRPWRGLIPVIGLSRLAVMYLFEKRRRLTQRLQAGEIARMPFCEAFVATELMQSALFKVADLSEFGATERFEFWPPILDRNVNLGPEPAFIHPVLDEARFIPNRLRHESNPASFLDPSSHLRHDFNGVRLEAAAPFVLDAIRRIGDAAGAARLLRQFPGLAGL